MRLRTDASGVDLLAVLLQENDRNYTQWYILFQNLCEDSGLYVLTIINKDVVVFGEITSSFVEISFENMFLKLCTKIIL